RLLRHRAARLRFARRRARAGPPRHRLRPGPARRDHSVVVVERAAAERAIADLLVALGADPHAEHLIATPRRVAAALERLLTPRPLDAGTFTSDAVDDGLVVARDIRFRSLCAHHLVPFDGVAHVGFVPDGRTVGLSKLARVVEWSARDLQVQERLTRQVANRGEGLRGPKSVRR